MFDWLKATKTEEAPPSTSKELVVAEPVVEFTEVFEVRDPMYDEYEVVHFPYMTSARCFYPRHRDGWIFRCFNGELKFFSDETYCEHFKTEKEAWQCVDESIQQRKHGFSRVIKR